MDLTHLTYRYCFQQIDEAAIHSFLMSQKEELKLDGTASVQKISTLLFQQGGVFAAFDPKGEIVGMIGFFFGDPKLAYADKETLYVYVAAISEPYRVTRLFYNGLTAIMMRSQAMGLTHFRMQAGLNDRYTNRIYGRIGRPLGVSQSLRGHTVMTYGGSIVDLLSRYSPKAAVNRTHNSQHAHFFALAA